MRESIARAAYPTMEYALLEANVDPEVASRFSNVILPFWLKPHQFQTLQAILAWNRVGVFDEARCLPEDTEFLTPTGWKRIDSFEEGDLVGQVDPVTTEVTFVPPVRYIKSESDDLLFFETKRGTSPVLQFSATSDHKLLAYDVRYRYGERKEKVASPVVCSPVDILTGKVKTPHLGFKNTFKVARHGVSLTEAEIRIMVAVIAEGYFPDQNDTVHMRLKKEREKRRIEHLLSLAGIEYSVEPGLPEGPHTYRFKAPRREKEFGSFWWGCSPEQLRLVVEEAEFWGGQQRTVQSSTGRKTAYQFSTESKESADFIQYAAASTGRTAALGGCSRTREGREPTNEYVVTFRDKESVYYFTPEHISKVSNYSKDRSVYCFEVPSGYFVTRYRGRIVLTGNCGKTAPMQLAATYFAAFNLKSVFLMPPALFLQFEEEFNKIQNTGVHLRFLTGTPKAREALLKQIAEGVDPANVLVMTKEIFKKHLNDLMLLKVSALFYDECHIGLQSAKFHSPGGQAKKKQLSIYGSVKTFIDSSPERRLILSTGTPLPNEIAGAYPLISLKSPKAYVSEWDFNTAHVTYRPIEVDTKYGPKMIYVVDSKGYMQVDLFHKNLYHQAVRARKFEALSVKVPNIQLVPVKLHAPHLSVYRKLMKDRVLEIGEQLLDARQQSQLRMTALQLITDPSVGLKEGQTAPNAVIETVEALLDSIYVKNNKVVLFANFVRSVELLEKAFSKYSPATVYGPNGSTRNAQNAQRFKNDPECRILIANWQAGGVGLTLGHVSQNVIFVEPVSTPGAFDQAASRVILDGQTEPVSVYILEIKDTISPKLIEAMRGKAEANNKAIKDKKTMLDELLGLR